MAVYIPSWLGVLFMEDTMLCGVDPLSRGDLMDGISSFCGVRAKDEVRMRGRSQWAERGCLLIVGRGNERG